MTADGFDLDAYLRRISYEGARDASLPVLAAVVAAHATAIPYENIDVLLKRGIRLDLGSLQQKLVLDGRGGYCFEQNTVLEAGLVSLGFAVTRLIARVVRGRPTDPVAPLVHKVLRIDLPQGPYIVDVGFGNLTPTAPLALRPEQVQSTPHEPFRLLPHRGDLMVQARLGEAWDSLFHFALTPTPPVDYELSNWFTSTCPASPFLANLIVARPTANGRATVFNRRFTIRDRDNRTIRRVLNGIDDYWDVLVGQFGLRLDDGELAAITAEMASHMADEQVHPSFL